MSSYTHFNIQFIPKKGKKVTQEHLCFLSNALFANSTWAEYSDSISSSWSGMFIFEIDESNNCVAFEITPIRAHYLTYILDDIRDQGNFEIRMICTYEEGNDWLEIYNEKGNHSTTCIYLFDEIRLTCFDDHKGGLPLGIFNKESLNQYSFKKICRYNSHCEFIENERSNEYNSLLSKCAIKERNNYILKKCSKQFPEVNWYSDSEVLNFMKKFENGNYKDTIKSVEFFYKSKLVRLYDCGEFKECFMLDNWFNLDNETFDNLKKY